MNARGLPSSVVEFVLPHHMASLIRGGANAGPWRNEELCPKGTPIRDVEATTPPKARNSSPCYGVNNTKDQIQTETTTSDSVEDLKFIKIPR